MSKIEKMTLYLSDKVKVLSFISIVMVIYIHMYYTEGEGMPVFNFVSTLLGGGICRVAVPLFYVISGYLFFLKADGFQSVYGKMRKRVKTLLIPYLLANVLTFLFYMALNLLTRYSSALDRVVNFKVIDTFDSGVIQVLIDIFWGPIAFQLWFVRDLMILVLFSPLLYAVIKSLVTSKRGLLLLGIMEVFLICYDQSALFWFTAGSIFSLSPFLQVDSILSLRKYGICLGVIYLALCVTNAFQLLPAVLLPIISLSGVPAIWILYSVVTKRQIFCTNRAIAKACDFTFFIYLVHEPMLNIFKKFPLLLNRSETVITISYLFIPFLFVIAACCMGVYTKKYFAKLYYIFTGGR